MKVVSFSLWGTSQKYTLGALKNAVLVKRFYPGWVARYYFDSSVPETIILSLRQHGAQTIMMSPSYRSRGMLWRFLPSCDPDVSLFVSRDCDSRITDREASAVSEWLSSGKDFHIIKDHPWHQNDQILGGMWGAKCNHLRGLGQWINEWPSTFNDYGHDQRFLDKYVYPVATTSLYYNNDFSPEGLSIPIPMRGYRFIGAQYDENDIPDFESLVALAISKKNIIMPGFMSPGFL